jgi:hypothetical protein
MARASRLSYQEARKERATSIIRQLLVLVLTVVIGILISVTVNAQTTSAKKKTSSYKKYKVKNRAKANHYANACEILSKKKASGEPIEVPVKFKTSVRNSNVATAEASMIFDGLGIPAIQHSIIREIVAQNLKERSSNDSFQLSPLQCKLHGNKMSFADTNPFFFALEFALQGRTVIIDDQLVIKSQQNLKLNSRIGQHIKDAMTRMGAPADRLTLASDNNGDSSQVKRLNESVTFTVL